jgi:hypothetical protein
MAGGDKRASRPAGDELTTRQPHGILSAEPSVLRRRGGGSNSEENGGRTFSHDTESLVVGADESDERVPVNYEVSNESQQSPVHLENEREMVSQNTDVRLRSSTYR